MDNGVLINKSVEMVVPDSEECVTRCRIEVSSKYRPSVLLLAHEGVFAGHLRLIQNLLQSYVGRECLQISVSIVCHVMCVRLRETKSANSSSTPTEGSQKY